ncbi:cation transport ATPase [Methylorubrum rhodinum]|uniref:Cation transport ATPase n=1 Tax=Methylorubrum rhodinum TaxID=29428 RepID=A0A840ZQ65_9HYPH|nr:cation transport ATPase [Methylorubrum rhodinum]
MVGLGLSLVGMAAGMAAAAFGHLSPLQGALLQEAIDVAVILNALRVLWGIPGDPVPGASPGLP